ncbi:hypothetical protein H4R26_003219 [Coemansia thaxteri]|uniref:Uncharacterized protein n=1 Tax=Coemansia thaxteri TaxID=2663907 RepID=A0A9W8EHT7_9FUNG|nr:hypothetical protein H4R26_003219 [Coemansia thaxteri]KAJ2483985.1 hypothetical protein EV174_002801 [Coemansia sp. RSA 2320]
MRVSLTITLALAVTLVAAHPLGNHGAELALRSQALKIHMRDEMPSRDRPHSSDSRDQPPPVAPANGFGGPSDSNPGSPSASEHGPARGPEPEHVPSNDRSDPPQHVKDESQSPSQRNSNDDRASTREQPQAQSLPQPQPPPQSQSQTPSPNNGERGSEHNHDNSNSNDGRQEDPRPQGDQNNAHVSDHRPEEDSRGVRPDVNGPPTQVHFEQVEHPGNNPSNVDRLTQDVVNDNRNGVHSNIVQHVALSGNNVNGVARDNFVHGNRGVTVNGKGNMVMPPLFM